MKYLKVIIYFFIVFLSVLNSRSQTLTISGYIKDGATGEELIGASVYVKSLNKGTTTNVYGFYSLTLPAADSLNVTISCLGYEQFTRRITPADHNKTLNIEMKTAASLLKEVTVIADDIRKEGINSAQMSTIKIPVTKISCIPSLGGETDILKVMQLMPGIAQGGEGTTSLFVRGGDADQNLVLLDEAVVYNVGHLFGFFSVFNPDAIKDMQMITGGFPANYGGRLSSVLDIRMKEGNLNEFHGTGGVGLLSSRIALEGPIIKNKMSFIVSARRTYIDKVFSLIGLNLPYYFYDINMKMNYKVSEKNRLYFSTYFGNDVLKFSSPAEEDTASQDSAATPVSGDPLNFGFKLKNSTTTVRWNHLFSSRLFSNVSLIFTKFAYDVQGSFMDNSVLIKSKINDVGIKADFTFFKKPEHTVQYGLLFTGHNFRPNVVSTSGQISEYLKSQEGNLLSTAELGVYWLNERDINRLWKMNYGLRFNMAEAKDTGYAGLEPRLSVRYMLSEKNSLKFGYSRMKQYIHRVSSSSIALPTDLWYPVTRKVKPQIADQVNMGYSRDFTRLKSLFTIEAYYKGMRNLIEFKEGANLILNDNFEDELLNGTGYSWGFETLFKRDEGRWNGWMSYTLSWSKRHFDDLNDGDPFYAKYDRRHNFSIVFNYRLSRRWDFSAVWVYSTGSRFTAQIGQYLMPKADFTDIEVIPIYTKRNEVKMSPSHRLDVNFVLKPNPDKKRRYKSEWHFGVYNLYARATPYRINIVPDGAGGYKYQEPGLFGFILSIAYNFKF